MHVLLKHARRVALGVAVGALLLAAAPGSGRAEILTLCISPSSQKVVLPLGGSCNSPNRLITWDSNGVQGPSGPQGPKGMQGPQGPTGTAGSVRAPRSGRTGWSDWDGRKRRSNGSDRSGWANGSARTPRANRADRSRLVRLDRPEPPASTEPSSTHWVVATLAATSSCSLATRAYWGRTETFGSSPVFYGPGNGADTILESEAVPIDASTVTQLWVQTKSAPGAGESYSFQLCINSDCTTPPITCSINLPNLTECNDLAHSQKYKAGDTIALRGTATDGAAPTEVSWMVVVHQTGGDVVVGP